MEHGYRLDDGSWSQVVQSLRTCSAVRARQAGTSLRNRLESMMGVNQDKVIMTGLVRELGVGRTETNVEHITVLVQALRIFDSRNAVRGDLWAEHEVEAAIAKAK